MVVRADDAVLAEGASMPQRIEMLTFAMATLVQGKDRILERVLKADFVDGCIEMIIKGRTLRGLQKGKVSVEVTQIDRRDLPVPIGDDYYEDDGKVEDA